MSTFIEQPPRVEAWINQVCNERIEHHVAIGEMIDNAFDAGATSVTVEFNSKKGFVLVTDNGNGCSEPNVIITPGERQQHRTTKLGRYGIGAKNFAFFYGGPDHIVNVDSITPTGTRHTAGVNWKWAKRENKWVVEVGDPVPADASRHGTSIKIASTQLRKLPVGKDFESMIDKLNFTYSRALRGVTGGGRRSIVIIRDGEAVQLSGWEPPQLVEPIDVTVEVSGRRARVRAGIVADGQINKRSGLTYFYNYRVIIPHTSKGCGDYDKSRFCGFVELLDGWSLTKNKDNISANEDELFDAVFRVVEPALKKAASTAHVIQSRELNDRAQAHLDAMTGHEPDAKAKRGPRTGEHGSVEPTGTGRRHTRAAVEQPGATFVSGGKKKRQRELLDSRVRMSFEERGEDEPPITVDLRGRTVECNVSHPWVAASRQVPEEMAKHALWAWCVAFTLSHDQQISIDAHAVFKALGRAISDSRLNGAPMLRMVKTA